RANRASLDQRIAAEHALEAAAPLGLDVYTAPALVVTLYVEETAVGLARQIELLQACGRGDQHPSVHGLAPEVRVGPDRRATLDCADQPGKRELALADDAIVGMELFEDRRRHDGEASAAEHDRRVCRLPHPRNERPIVLDVGAVLRIRRVVEVAKRE